jgi:hypothetical protein
VGLIIVKLLRKVELPLIRRDAIGWQLYAGSRTGLRHPGIPEGIPRTATI